MECLVPAISHTVSSSRIRRIAHRTARPLLLGKQRRDAAVMQPGGRGLIHGIPQPTGLSSSQTTVPQTGHIWDCATTRVVPVRVAKLGAPSPPTRTTNTHRRAAAGKVPRSSARVVRVGPSSGR